MPGTTTTEVVVYQADTSGRQPARMYPPTNSINTSNGVLHDTSTYLILPFGGITAGTRFFTCTNSTTTSTSTTPCLIWGQGTASTSGLIISSAHFDYKYFAESIPKQAFSFEDITALEYLMLSEMTSLKDLIFSAVLSSKRVDAQFLIDIVQEELDTMPDRELYPLVLKCISSIRNALTSLGKKIEASVGQKIRKDLDIFHGGIQTDYIINGGNFYSATSRSIPDRLIFRDDQVTEDVVREILQRTYGDIVQRYFRDFQILQKALLWVQTPEGQQFWKMEESRVLQEFAKTKKFPEHRINSLKIENVFLQAQKKLELKKLKEKRDNDNIVKASIKKATKLFERMDQHQQLRMFVSNQEVVIDSPQSHFKFVVHATGGPGWLFDRTQKHRAHTPFDLTVLTKDDVFLTKLCIYLRQTPILDQLIALSMFVDTGEELKLLQKANWYGGHNQWTEEKTQYVVSKYPELMCKCPEPRKDGGIYIPPREITSRGSLTIPDDQRWTQLEGRVHQWVNTWFSGMVEISQQLLH